MEMTTLLFVNQTQTIIICFKNRANEEFRLLCLRLNGNRWVEQNFVQIEVASEAFIPMANSQEYLLLDDTLHELAGPAVLLVCAGLKIAVHVELNAHRFGRVSPINFDIPFCNGHGNASVIEKDGKTLVAFPEIDGNGIYLNALEANTLFSLSKLDGQWKSVITLNNQLAAVRLEENWAHSIVALDITDCGLSLSTELLPAAVGVQPRISCVAGKDRVILWDSISRDLIVYTCVQLKTSLHTVRVV